MNMCKSVYMKVKDVQNKLKEIEERCEGCELKPEPEENCTTCLHNVHKRYNESKSAHTIYCDIWTEDVHEHLCIQDVFPDRLIGRVQHKVRCQHYIGR